jgi:hypothetical protein
MWERQKVAFGQVRVSVGFSGQQRAWFSGKDRILAI